MPVKKKGTIFSNKHALHKHDLVKMKLAKSQRKVAYATICVTAWSCSTITAEMYIQVSVALQQCGFRVQVLDWSTHSSDLSPPLDKCLAEYRNKDPYVL